MIWLLSFAALVAATISGIVGMAGGITLLSVMVLVMPLELVVPIHGIVQLVSNSSRTLILLKNVHRGMSLSLVCGIPFGGWLGYTLLSQIERPTWLLVLVAGFLLYVAFKPERLPEIKLPIWAFSILGLVAGVFGCLVGSTGPLIAPFFVRKDLPKEAMVATKAACQVAIHLVKIPVFLSLEFNYAAHWDLIVAMSIGVIAGTQIGTSLLRRVSQKVFMRALKFVMFVIALRLLYKVFIVAT